MKRIWMWRVMAGLALFGSTAWADAWRGSCDNRWKPDGWAGHHRPVHRSNFTPRSPYYTSPYGAYAPVHRYPRYSQRVAPCPPRRVWQPGCWVVREQACGRSVRIWQPGRYLYINQPGLSVVVNDW